MMLQLLKTWAGIRVCKNPENLKPGRVFSFRVSIFFVCGIRFFGFRSGNPGWKPQTAGKALSDLSLENDRPCVYATKCKSAKWHASLLDLKEAELELAKAKAFTAEQKLYECDPLLRRARRIISRRSMKCPPTGPWPSVGRSSQLPMNPKSPP